MVTVVPDPNEPTPEERTAAKRAARTLLRRMAADLDSLRALLSTAGVAQERRAGDIEHALEAIDSDIVTVRVSGSRE